MNAHTVITPPTTDAAPHADAPMEVRETWCAARVSSLIAGESSQDLPDDVRASQHFETEFNYCKLDPQEYDRLTREED